MLDEHATEYFQLHPAGAHVYPFMLATAPVVPAARRLIPAAVHIDGSTRVQTVSRATNLLFWSLIEGDRRRTGSTRASTRHPGHGHPQQVSASTPVRAAKKGDEAAR